MDIKSKRKRSENWDSSQKILLRQLIEEKIGIVENKNVDTNTTKSKREAWTDILRDFNNISPVERDVNQLQNQWKAIKMKAKANQSAYKRSQSATGGGPPPKSPDPEEEKLVSLIPHVFEVDTNEFDCDVSDSMIQKENVYPVDKTPPKAETSRARNPLKNIATELYEVEFLDEEIPSIVSPPCQLTPSPKKKLMSKKKMKTFKDDDLKMQLFEASMDNKRLAKKLMQEEHDLKTKLLEEQIKQVHQERKQSAELHELNKQKLKD